MTYVPGHSVWVGYALENGTINDSVLPPTITNAPTNFAYLGYLDVPEVTHDYGNKKGFSVGSPYAMYEARGANNPSLSLNIRLGATGFLPYCLRGAYGNYGMQPLVFYVGVAGQYTDIYRFCYVDTLALAIQEGSGQEVTAAVTLQAMARQISTNPSYVKSPSLSDLSSAYGAPLMYHDVKSFLLTDRASVTYQYRKMLTGLTLNVAHNLERKGIRPNFGDDNPLSRTCYEIMPHLVTVTGEINLHDRLPEDFYSIATQSQNWGDIAVGVSDATGIDSGPPNELNLSIVRPVPVSRTNRGVEAGAQISHSVSFVADNVVIS